MTHISSSAIFMCTAEMYAFYMILSQPGIPRHKHGYCAPAWVCSLT